METYFCVTCFIAVNKFWAGNAVVCTEPLLPLYIILSVLFSFMANILTTLAASSIRRFGGGKIAFSFIESADSEIIPYTWAAVSEASRRLSVVFVEMGVMPGDAVAVFAPNMAGTLIAEMAAYAIRAVTVSVYPTSGSAQVEYIVKDSKAKIVFVGTQNQYAVMRDVLAACPDVELMVAMSPEIVFDPMDVSTRRFSDLVADCTMNADYVSEVERRMAEAVLDDVATLLYTSGTTGEPKGTVLPHSCFNAQLEFHRRRLDTLSDVDTSMCFLPLSHIFEKAWTYFCLWSGIHVTINFNPKSIAGTLSRVRPTCMCSVPRFWEKAYMAVQDRLASMSGVGRRLFNAALQVGYRRNLEYMRAGKKVPAVLAAEYWLCDKLFYSRIRSAIGFDNPNILPTAGAPLSDSIVEFFRAVGIPILIGYGLSETTATVTCFPRADYKIGSVGTVIDGVRVKIGEDNEILVKGPTVMRGYYNKEAETRAAFTADGWLRTGDAGRLLPDGSLVLTERIKDLFKTSNGKYIAPQAIESRLGGDPFIEQVAVIADRRKYVTAIIIPAFGALKKYARSKRIAYRNLDDLINNSAIHDMMARRIEKLQSGLAAFEKIKKFIMLSREFTIESGEITNTLKLCRSVISSHYSREIESMYNN